MSCTYVVRALWCIALLLSMGLGVTACSGSGGGDVSQGDTTTADQEGPSQEEQEAFNHFVDQLPQKYCEWLQSCGKLEGDVAACTAEMKQEVGEEIGECPGLLPFYLANRTALDGCLAGQTGDCEGDDLDRFCPAMGSFDFKQDCDTGSAAGDGGPGSSCSSDSDCNTGMRCLQSVLPGPEKYCAPQCNDATWQSDCMQFIQSSFYYKLPDKLANISKWNNDALWRVASCENLENTPTVGEADGKSWCIWVCPDKSAGIYNEQRAVEACGCLPNFRKLQSDPMICEWNDDPPYECSLFTPCTVANTDVSECSQGEFTCFVSEELEGVCVDVVTGEEIAGCIAKCQWDCDVNCLSSNCGTYGSEACADMCCKSDDPACN